MKKSIPDLYVKQLELAIQNIVSNKDMYVKNPGVDFTRDRKLTLSSMLYLLLSMGDNSLKKELFNYSELTGIDVSSSAFVQQRKKIKPAALRDIFNQFNTAVKRQKTFRGYLLMAADGSAISMSRNPQSDTFIHPGNHPEGYNQYHLNALYDLLTHTYIDVDLQPASKTDERDALIKMLKRNRFNKKTIIVVDRGYESYNMFANFIEADGIDYVCRVKDSCSSTMSEIKKLPMQELDRDINIEITTTQTKEDKKHNRRFIQTGSKKGKTNSPKTYIGRWDFSSPYMLKLRVVRFLLDTGNYETIVTSLPRNKFSIEDIKELYHMRWGIETSFRELKYFSGLINLHGKCDDFVAQEIYAALTIYNLCEHITASVLIKNADNKTHVYRINYSMAFFLCRNYYRRKKINGEKLIEDIGRFIEPIRPGRKDKRNIRNKAFIGFVYRIAA